MVRDKYKMIEGNKKTIEKELNDINNTFPGVEVVSMVIADCKENLYYGILLKISTKV